MKPHPLVVVCVQMYIMTYFSVCMFSPSLPPSLSLPLPSPQFNRFDPEDGRISERDFAKMILSYADINDQQKKKYMKRVKRAYEDGKVSGQRVNYLSNLFKYSWMYILYVGMSDFIMILLIRAH